MDGNKVSHMDDSVNLTISDKIEGKFGKLYHTTGEKHTLLGMGIDFIGRKKAVVSMPHHVD